MKIAIDIRALQEERHSGVQEYLLNLLEALLAIDKKNQYLLFSSGYTNPLKKPAIRQLLKKYSQVKSRHLAFPNRVLNLCWKFSNFPDLEKFLGHPDVFFAPNINIIPQKLLLKTILTFHDLSFERFEKFFSPKGRLWHKFIRPKFLAQRAQKLIAVSSATAQDLVTLYGIYPSKIKIIPLGIKKTFKPLRNKEDYPKKIKKKYHLPPKFILYLGTLEPRKNVEGLIRAYNILRKEKEFKSYKLVLAGPKGWLWKKIIQAAKNSPFSQDIIFTGPILRHERVYIYNLAHLFVYPSFLEGFGLPPLEAMASGVPVISSNRSSLPSVVGQGGILIDPYRIEELVWAMKEILKDKNLYLYLRSQGIKQAERFSWQKTAQQTLDCFSSSS